MVSDNESSSSKSCTVKAWTKNVTESNIRNQTNNFERMSPNSLLDIKPSRADSKNVSGYKLTANASFFRYIITCRNIIPQFICHIPKQGSTV